MTAPVFVDTAYLVALTNVADAHHARALKLAKAWAHERRALVTSAPS